MHCVKLLPNMDVWVLKSGYAMDLYMAKGIFLLMLQLKEVTATVVVESKKVNIKTEEKNNIVNAKNHVTTKEDKIQKAAKG